MPAAASTITARTYEREYLRLQRPEMERRHRETLKRLRGKPNLVELARQGELVAEIPE